MFLVILCVYFYSLVCGHLRRFAGCGHRSGALSVYILRILGGHLLRCVVYVFLHLLKFRELKVKEFLFSFS